MASIRIRSGRFITLALALAAGAAACGGSSGGSPLSPSALSTITGITLAVNPPGVGATVLATATVSLSSGNSTTVSTGFASDTTSVATVTSAGAITGVSIGDVTISVDYQGFKASKKVRVLPNYGGVFSGGYSIDRCVDTGDFLAQGYCANLISNATLPIAFNNVQSPDLTSMTSQFALGSLVGTGTGAIAPNGALTYTGSFQSGTSRIDLQNFAGGSPAVGQISGRFEQTWTDTVMAGQLFMTCTIQSLLRTSGGSAPAGLPVFGRR